MLFICQVFFVVFSLVTTISETKKPLEITHLNSGNFHGKINCEFLPVFLNLSAVKKSTATINNTE